MGSLRGREAGANHMVWRLRWDSISRKILMPPETRVGGVGKQSEVLRGMAVADTTTTGGDGSGMLESRLARLEGLVEGVRTSLTITFSAVPRAGGLVLAFGWWTVIRIDVWAAKIGDLNTKVDQLPAKITSDLLALVPTLSQAIPAAKQPPPQIILMPAPQPAPSTAESAKPA